MHTDEIPLFALRVIRTRLADALRDHHKNLPPMITDAMEEAPDSAENHAALVALIGEPDDLARAFIKCCMTIKLREQKALAEARQNHEEAKS